MGLLSHGELRCEDCGGCRGATKKEVSTRSRMTKSEERLRQFNDETVVMMGVR